MSQQIEEQIVKMQFDNASFEKNAKETMSTLDKLKALLKFDKVNMTPLQQAFNETEATATKAGVHIRDIWLKMGNVIEDQVANKIVESGKKIANALSFEGINDGFKEYELKMGSIQTIMAGTGESLATVNKYLDELNTYSDKTIYSFSDMTESIGKFTNNGVKLKDAVAAIKGIANEAAVSGATAANASHAMYNFAQALSAGYVKLIDWKSIENANMATTEFKQTLLDVAKGLKLVKDAGNGTYQVLTKNANGGQMKELVSSTKNFNDSLQYQWMTTDVLNKALKIYATDIRELTPIEKERYEAELAQIGITGEMLEKYEQLGIKAANSATEVKTFTMLVDSLKEAIGSGWAMTWQYFIGDFNQAKALWTDVNNVLSGVVDGLSNSRNELLKAGLTTGWEKFVNIEGKAIPQSEKFREVLVDLARANGLLTKEQYVEIDSTEKFLKYAHELNFVTGDLLTESVDDYYNILKKMNDDELTAFGVTPEEVDDFAKLNDYLKANTNSADEFAKSINALGGRENIIQGLKNLFHSFGDTLSPIKQALDSVFEPLNPQSLYAMTVRFREFTEQLQVSPEAANTIRTSFTLMFGAIKTVLGAISTTIGGVTKLILPVLNLFDAIFGVIGKIVAALTGSKGALGAAEKFGKASDKVSKRYLKIMQKIADVINKVADTIRNMPESPLFIKIHDDVEQAINALKAFWEEFTNLPVIQEMINDFNRSIERIQKVMDKASKAVQAELKRIKTMFNQYVNLENFNKVLAITYTKIKDFIKLVRDFGTRIINFFKDIKEGKEIVESFKDNFGDIIDKIKELKQNLEDFFKSIFEKGDEMGSKFNLDTVAQSIHDFVSNITPDQITMIAVAGSFMLIALNLLKLSEAMRNAMDAFTGVGAALKNVINSYVKKQKSAIVQVAEAIAIMAASFWVISTIPAEKMDGAIKAMTRMAVALGVLVGVLAAASFVTNQFGGGAKLELLAAGLAMVAGSFLIAVAALKALEYVNVEDISMKLIEVLGVLGVVSLITVILGKFNTGFSKGALTVVAISASLLLVAESMYRISEIPADKLKASMSTLFKLMISLAAIVAAAGQVGIFSAVGLLSVVILFEKLLPTLEKIANYDYTKIGNGLEKNKEVMRKLGGVLLVMAALGVVAGNRVKGVGIGLLAISGAFTILTGVAKLAGSMKPGQLKRGITFLTTCTVMFGILEFLSERSRLGSWGGKDSEGSKAFIRMGIAMGILVGVAKLASMMKPAQLAQGIIALGFLEGLVLGLVMIAKQAENSQGILKSISAMLFAISLVFMEIGILSILDWKKMVAATVGMTSIIAALAALAFGISKSFSVIDKDTQKVKGATLAIVSAMTALAILGGFLVVLADKPWEQSLAAAAGMAIVITAVGSVCKSISNLDGYANLPGMQALGMTVSMVLVASLLLAGLCTYFEKNKINPSTIMATSGAIALSCVALSAAIAALSLFKTNNWGTVLAGAVGAVIALAGVTASIYALSKWGGNTDAMLAAAQSIAIGSLGLIVPLIVLGVISKYCQNVNLKTAGAIVITAVGTLVGVASAITLLSRFGGPSENILAAAQAITQVMVWMTVPMAVLGVLGKFCKGSDFGGMAAVVGAGVLALGGVALVLGLFANQIDMPAIDRINAVMPSLLDCLSAVIKAAAVLSVVGIVADIAPAALLGGLEATTMAILALGEVVTAIALLGHVINETDAFDGALSAGLDTLIEVLGKIGKALGDFIGGIGEGIAEKSISIADNLNTFSEHIQTFFTNMQTIGDNQSAIKGIKNIADVLVEVGKIDLKNKDFQKLAKLDFGKFGEVIAKFAESVKGIPDDSVRKASMCSLIAQRLTSSNWNVDVEMSESFASSVDALGFGISQFCERAKGISESAVADSQRACDAAVPMIDLTKTLKAQNGVIQWLLGEKNLGAFGSQLYQFANGLYMFVEKVVDISKLDSNYAASIKAVADATLPLIDLASNLENMGGKLADIVGDNTLELFGETIVPFADHLKNFVAKISYIASHEPNYKQLMIDCADAVTPLVDMANSLQNMGGVLAAFSGDNTLDRFGERLVDFGDSLKKYVKKLGDVEFTKISDSNATIGSLIELGTAASGIEKGAFDNLVDGLKKLAQVPISPIAEEIETGTPILVEKFKTMLNKLTELVILRTESDHSYYATYGKSIDIGISEGIMACMYRITVALMVMNQGIRNFLDIHMTPSAFEVYGNNLAQGITNGINAGAGDAIAAAESLAASVAAVLPTIWKEHSPSRLSYGFGKFFALGGANGISDYSSVVVSAVEKMSEDVVNIANKMITAISSVIDSDMDIQPTIRPVLDTSDIEAKAGNVNKLFKSSDLQLAYKASGAINQAYANKTIDDVQNQSSTPQQITFTQNNYSPKALSRVEIYRNTKNQLSMMEGVIRANA